MLASRPHVLWTALTRCDTFFGFSGWNSYNLQTKVLSTIFQKKKRLMCGSVANFAKNFTEHCKSHCQSWF